MFADLLLVQEDTSQWCQRFQTDREDKAVVKCDREFLFAVD